MNINEMTREELESIPHREWQQDIGLFDSLIILPARIKPLHVAIYNVRAWLASLFKLQKPDIWAIDGMHDSGYRCMDFVAVRDGKPLCRLSGCSDVIHIEGIGGYGLDWLERHEGVPDAVYPVGWSIDCLAQSGLLQLFCRRKLSAGLALSSFDIYSSRKERR